MKRFFICILVIFCAVSAFAAKYNVGINVFSNESSFPKRIFSYYIDFKQEINLASVKMHIVKQKNKKVDVYVVPLAKYKALIYFMPHKKMEEDSELYYILSFASGKWDGKPCGSATLKKNIRINPNLIPNYSFEDVEKTVDSFMTWDGRTSIIGWGLQDFSGKYLSLDKIKSTCRSSTKEAFQGTRSLCFSNGTPRSIQIKGKERKILISGSAYTSKLIVLKPDTIYKLSFFVKITKQIDNEMNFQGIGVSLSFMDYKKKAIPGGLFSALYSINAIMQEEYLNKWVYVEAYDITDQYTHFGRINITKKISGITYVDMLELREVKERDFPEIIVEEIIKIK